MREPEMVCPGASAVLPRAGRLSLADHPMTLAVGGVAPNQSCPRPLFDLAGRTQKCTIAKRTVPLAIFGPVGYGLRSGILGAPARATQAASPV
jgi:hypothetical protein